MAQPTQIISSSDDPAQVLPTQRSFTYNKAGMLTQASLSYPGSSQPTTEVDNAHDAYQQITNQLVKINGSTHSNISQSWDPAARRTSLTITTGGQSHHLGYSHNAAGALTNISTQSPQGQLDFAYTYDQAGMLTNRQTPWLQTAIIQRDGQGRIREQSSSLTSTGQTLLHTTQTWRPDNKLISLTTTRSGQHPQTRNFTYNVRGALVKETNSHDFSTTTYQHDALGLNTLTASKTFLDDSPNSPTNSWGSPNGTLGEFARLINEVQDGQKLRATGVAPGASQVDVLLTVKDLPTGALFDENQTRQVTDVTLNAEDWSAQLDLPTPGEYTLRAIAHYLHKALEKYAMSKFTVTENSPYLPKQQSKNTYDQAGCLTNKTWANGRTQSFLWDTENNLIQVIDTNPHNTTPAHPSGTILTWNATYDPLGRRLQTTTTHTDLATGQLITPTNEHIQNPATIANSFDPQVEFLAITTQINTSPTTLKVYGPDISENFGRLQGIGGLEATISTNQIHAPITDTFGNIQGYLTPENSGPYTTHWNPTTTNAYGPKIDTNTLTYGQNTNNLLAATSWRGYSPDPTGLIHMGKRYYNPTAGRFISPDPLGHSASMDLYSFANGDPINFVDPWGRDAKETQNMASSFNPVGAMVVDFVNEFNVLNPNSTIRTTHDSITSFWAWTATGDDAFFQNAMDKSTAGQLYSQNASPAMLTAHNTAMTTASIAGVVATGSLAVHSTNAFLASDAFMIGQFNAGTALSMLENRAILATALPSPTRSTAIKFVVGSTFVIGAANEASDLGLDNSWTTGMDLGSLSKLDTAFSAGGSAVKTVNFVDHNVPSLSEIVIYQSLKNR